MGDFNLDYRKNNDDNYVHKNLFSDFDEILSDLNLIQMVDFITWSRVVGIELKESILDHIYTRSPTSISNISSIMPLFGDHRLITFCINEAKPKPFVNFRRDWRKYSKEHLCNELSLIDWNLNIDDVQGFWNALEAKLISVIDNIIPMTKFVNNTIKERISSAIKNKINIRNRLLKKRKNNFTPELKSRIANLTFEIKTHFFSKRRLSVRKGITPGNNKALWQAVKLAKNHGTPNIPNSMTLGGLEILSHEQSHEFAKFFVKKVNDIVKSTKVDDNVYNGIKKIDAQCEMFMTRENI